MDEDRKLAKKIAEISPLSEDTAFSALQTGGRPRELVLSILETEQEYAADNASVAAAKKKLDDLIPA
jgi:hypothetical protein